MRKYLPAILSVLATAAGGLGAKLFFDLRTRRNAREARPKLEALLDEMLAIIAAHKADLEKIVFNNELTTVNDERLNRDLMLMHGDTSYSLDVSRRLGGRRAGRVTVRLHRRRGDQVLHLYWPDIGDYWPLEPWLKERLDRLDALVGKVSRRDSLKRRFPGIFGDDGPPNTN